MAGNASSACLRMSRGRLISHARLSKELHVGPVKGKEKEALLRAASISYGVLYVDVEIDMIWPWLQTHCIFSAPLPPFDMSEYI